MNEKKPGSWKYQKGRYKQVNIKFDLLNENDLFLYERLKEKKNISKFIKSLISKEGDVK